MASLQDRLASAVAPRYVVDRQLAAGGMGVVFLAHDPVLGREVAIKVLPPELATAVAVERFLREARVLALLAHPHIVPVLEARRDDGLLWFAMPRITGDSLAHRLAIQGPLIPRHFRRMGLALLDALDHAHAQGVIHRDIKPSNIFIQGRHALLADFGVAQLTETDSDTITAADEVVGTRRYMAPEQMTGESASAASDLYAIGATLYEAVSGRRWDATGPTEARWRKIPSRVAAVLRRAVETEPAQRWPDVKTFRRAFERATRPPPPPLLVAGGALLTVLATLAISRAVARSSPPPVPRAALTVGRFAGRGEIAEELAQRVTLMLRGFPLLSVVRAAAVEAGSVDSTQTRVEGAVVLSPDSSGTLSLSVTEPGGAERVAIAGSARRLDEWALAVADSLVARLRPDWVLDFREFSAAGRPVAARRAYLTGKDLLQQRRWGLAEAAFRQAVALDTTFVLARWMTLLAMKWRRVPFVDDSLRDFLPRSDHLMEPWRGLAQAEVEPAIDRRLAALQAIAQRFPRHDLSRLLYANELFSRGPLVGSTLDRGVAELVSAAADLPELAQADTYLHTTWGALRLGDEPLARQQLAYFDATKVEHDSLSGLLHQAFRGRFQPRTAGFLRTVMRLRAGPSDAVSFAGMARVGLEFDDPDDQLAFANVVIAKAPESAMVASGFRARATALLLLGRTREAVAALDSAARRSRARGGYALESAELELLLPLVGISIAPGRRDTARTQLLTPSGSNSRRPRTEWALAVDAALTGRSAVADSLAGQLARRAAVDPISADLAPIARAVVLGESGQLDSALALSEGIRRDPGERIALGRGPLVRPITYLLRARWLERAGRDGEALRELVWYENNDFRGWPDGELQEGEMDAALSGVARFRRASLLLEAGQEERRACEMLARVAQLWHAADETMAPLRDSVMTVRRGCRA